MGDVEEQRYRSHSCCEVLVHLLAMLINNPYCFVGVDAGAVARAVPDRVTVSVKVEAGDRFSSLRGVLKTA